MLRRVGQLVGVLILGMGALSVVAQLAYPTDRALPFMQVGGLAVGGKSESAIIAQFNDYARNGNVTVKTPSRQWYAKWQSIGLAIDREASAETVVKYETWERFLPFSSVMRVLQAKNMSLIAVVNSERLNEFAAKLVAEDKAAAIEGVVSVKEGRVVINEAKNGYEYEVSEVQRQVKATPLNADAVVTLRPKVVPAIRPATELEATAKEAERIVGKSVEFKVGAQTYRPSRALLGDWISITEDGTKKLIISLNQAKMAEYLQNISKSVIVQPGTSTVTLLDGQEVARTAATAGQAVATDAAFVAIEQQLRAAGTVASVSVPIVNVAPHVVYVRNYSKANSGLQALIADWARTNGGNYGIVAREINGEQRYADYQPDKSFVTASTFKMFLAYAILQKISSNEITFEQKTDMNWTVDACLKEMILHSTNQCAISFFNLIGWQASEDIVKNAGFPATELNNQRGGEKYTTVRDEANFLLRLQAGTLMSQGHTDYLLDLMKRQVWRGGIPQGVPKGVTVADKVGFYNGYKHDVAIVYSPKGTYILAIMSYGGNDAKLADLSRRIYNFFNS